MSRVIHSLLSHTRNCTKTQNGLLEIKTRYDTTCFLKERQLSILKGNFPFFWEAKTKYPVTDVAKTDAVLPDSYCY